MALQSAHYCCSICGAKQSKAKGRGVVVEVHHPNGSGIDEIIDLVFQRLLCSPEEMTCLCQACHDKEHANGDWKPKVVSIMDRLMTDVHLRDHEAAGILGNILHECDEFRHLREIGQHGTKGGFGWCQRTGPRRVQFFAYCNQRGLHWTDDEANYGFLVFELLGPERNALRALRNTKTVDEAAITFELKYERSGVQAHAKRLAYAKQALEAWNARDEDSH